MKSVAQTLDPAADGNCPAPPMPKAPATPSAANQRHDRILELLQARGTCAYVELGKLLGVSSMTVRRDIDQLARRQALIKTLGGAQYSKVPQFLYETSLSSRMGVNRVAKELIAGQALGQVRPQQTVFLDGSSTCIAFARTLARSRLDLMVITNSALIAMEVGASPHAKVICVGGDYDPQSASFVGALAEEACGRFCIDTTFLSTKSFLAAEGTYESSTATLRIKQLVAKRSSRVVLLVDGTKFGQRALCKVLDVGAIGLVITDWQCPKGTLKVLRRAGCEVIVAAPACGR